jgi:hypothetical protein
VQAGCTDSHVNTSGGAPSRFVLLAQAGALAESESNLPAPRPCSGPACKQGAPRPFSTTPSLTRVGMEEWAMPVLLGESEGLDGFAQPPSPVGLDGIDAACSIFHPPRSSSRFFSA